MTTNFKGIKPSLVYAQNAPPQDRQAVSDDDYLSGYIVNLQTTGYKPIIQYENYYKFKLDSNIMYLLENSGAVPFDALQPFKQGAITKKISGTKTEFYCATTDTLGTNNWVRLYLTKEEQLGWLINSSSDENSVKATTTRRGFVKIATSQNDPEDNVATLGLIKQIYNGFYTDFLKHAGDHYYDSNRTYARGAIYLDNSGYLKLNLNNGNNWVTLYTQQQQVNDAIYDATWQRSGKVYTEATRIERLNDSDYHENTCPTLALLKKELDALKAQIRANSLPIGTMVVASESARDQMRAAGFWLCDGSWFHAESHPELVRILGGSQLPDARDYYVGTMNLFLNRNNRMTNKNCKSFYSYADIKALKSHPDQQPRLSQIFSEFDNTWLDWLRTWGGYLRQSGNDAIFSDSNAVSLNWSMVPITGHFPGAWLWNNPNEIIYNYNKDTELFKYNDNVWPSYNHRVYATDSGQASERTCTIDIRFDIAKYIKTNYGDHIAGDIHPNTLTVGIGFKSDDFMMPKGRWYIKAE